MTLLQNKSKNLLAKFNIIVKLEVPQGFSCVLAKDKSTSKAKATKYFKEKYKESTNIYYCHVITVQRIIIVKFEFTYI